MSKSDTVMYTKLFDKIFDSTYTTTYHYYLLLAQYNDIIYITISTFIIFNTTNLILSKVLLFLYYNNFSYLFLLLEFLQPKLFIENTTTIYHKIKYKQAIYLTFKLKKWKTVTITKYQANKCISQKIFKISIISNVCLFAFVKNALSLINLAKFNKFFSFWYCVSNFFRQILAFIQ